MRDHVTHWLVIASDRRERGNLNVLEGVKNDGIASVAPLPRNDAGGGFLTNLTAKSPFAPLFERGDWMMRSDPCSEAQGPYAMVRMDSEWALRGDRYCGGVRDVATTYTQVHTKGHPLTPDCGCYCYLLHCPDDVRYGTLRTARKSLFSRRREIIVCRMK